MAIGVADLNFSGPYRHPGVLAHRPGVWVVLDGRSLPPVAAGMAHDVREAVEDHPDRSTWDSCCDVPSVAVFYTGVDDNQERILQAVRQQFDLAGAPGHTETSASGDVAEPAASEAAASEGAAPAPSPTTDAPTDPGRVSTPPPPSTRDAPPRRRRDRRPEPPRERVVPIEYPGDDAGRAGDGQVRAVS